VSGFLRSHGRSQYGTSCQASVAGTRWGEFERTCWGTGRAHNGETLARICVGPSGMMWYVTASNSASFLARRLCCSGSLVWSVGWAPLTSRSLNKWLPHTKWSPW